jgi:soluble lytic murein transglycosylase-like protein
VEEIPPMNIPYAAFFVSSGRKYGVDPALLAAIARAESQFNIYAINPISGALGLMQIMPEVARSLNVNPMDPVQAIDGAARLLAQSLKRFGSETLAIAAYNAGPGAVAKAGGIPPIPETQKYVRDVRAYQSEYESAIGTGGGLGLAVLGLLGLGLWYARKRKVI